MRRNHRILLERKFSEYLDVLDSTALQPTEPFLSYDFDFLENRAWRIPFAEWMVSADLLELTNQVNEWRSLLLRWAAWNHVIGNESDNLTWSLRSEFCDSLVHNCLLRPSSIREALISVATETLHQLRMAEDSNVPDALVTDAKPPQYKMKIFGRREKEAQLREMLQRREGGGEFWTALELINSPQYQRATFDYRNSHAHHIGPRLGFGEVRPVIRSIEEASELKPAGDGTFRLESIPGKSVVSYSFGGLLPLDFETARQLNLEQYYAARRAYDRYVQLLKVYVCKLKPAE